MSLSFHQKYSVAMLPFGGNNYITLCSNIGIYWIPIHIIYIHIIYIRMSSVAPTCFAEVSHFGVSDLVTSERHPCRADVTMDHRSGEGIRWTSRRTWSDLYLGTTKHPKNRVQLPVKTEGKGGSCLGLRGSRSSMCSFWGMGSEAQKRAPGWVFGTHTAYSVCEREGR